MFTWLKQLIGISLYLCNTLVPVLSKSNFVLYTCSPQSFVYAKPCPSPNVPIENIWAISIHQAEVGWEGDHKPQLPEA